MWGGGSTVTSISVCPYHLTTYLRLLPFPTWRTIFSTVYEPFWDLSPLQESCVEEVAESPSLTELLQYHVLLRSRVPLWIESGFFKPSWFFTCVFTKVNNMTWALFCREQFIINVCCGMFRCGLGKPWSVKEYLVFLLKDRGKSNALVVMLLISPMCNKKVFSAFSLITAVLRMSCKRAQVGDVMS